MSGDNVKSAGYTKPDAGYQRIRESDPREVQVGVKTEVGPYFVL